MARARAGAAGGSKTIIFKDAGDLVKAGAIGHLAEARHVHLRDSTASTAGI
jgi:hypothetical protein